MTISPPPEEFVNGVRYHYDSLVAAVREDSDPRAVGRLAAILVDPTLGGHSETSLNPVAHIQVLAVLAAVAICDMARQEIITPPIGD